MSEEPFGVNLDSETFLPLNDLSNRTDFNSTTNEGTVAAFASWFATGPLKRARYKDFSSIGVIGGIVGAIIIKLNSFFFSYRLRSRINKYARGEVVILALITATLCYGNVFTRSDSVTLVSNLFTECRTKDNTGLCETILTSISSEAAVPTGIFLPSMAVGASFGRAVGMIVQNLHRAHPNWPLFSSCLDDIKCVTPAVYALVGAAAVLSSTTGMRVSVVVVMFELTGALVYVLPLMIAVTVSSWVAKLISTQSIFESVIRLHEYPYLEKEREYQVIGTARGIMTPVHDLVFISSKNQTLQSLQALLYHTPNLKNINNLNNELRNRRNSISNYETIQFQGFPVVLSAESMLVLGYISNNDLKLGLEVALSSNTFTSSTSCYFGSATNFDENYSTSSEANNSFEYRRSVSNSKLHTKAIASTSFNENISDYYDFEESDSVYIDLRPYMDHSPITVSPETPINVVIEIFRHLGIRQVIVAKHRVLYGIITKKDILKCVNEMDKPNSYSPLSFIFPSLGRN
ncbi:hypothetical protein BB561_003895 [Smittium simulii]|uniref:Chloride channel protein n=1 Tax=Smittium simulii TaxID=133385 RepID=A0A2T9YJ67_9FUNG|nr:hypothetical protein BB561_003895 [Smittium simulii]